MADYIPVHGGSHGPCCWEKTANVLAVRGHGVRAVDLPGRDDATAHVTLGAWVETLGREVDALRAAGGAAPVIVAHSMGSLTA